MNEKMVLVFFDEKRAEEYERRAAILAGENEEVDYHAGAEVIAGGDGPAKDREKAFK